MLSKKDLEQLSKKGITELQFETQMENFQKGFPFANLAGAATVGDGIVSLSLADAEEYAKIFEEEYNKALVDYRTIFEDDYQKYLDSFETGKIHAGYFSIDKKGHEVDPSINDKKE